MVRVSNEHDSGEGDVHRKNDSLDGSAMVHSHWEGVTQVDAYNLDGPVQSSDINCQSVRCGQLLHFGGPSRGILRSRSCATGSAPIEFLTTV